MVARITTGSGVGGAARYNDAKLIKSEAALLGIVNYPYARPELLTSTQRIDVLEVLSEQNNRVKETAVHVVLSFHPSEELSDFQLLRIAGDYMKELGYEDQPQLVYRHDDRPHPHIHIVTTRVEEGGKVISNSNNLYKSETARKAIEIEYNLVKAQEQGKNIQLAGSYGYKPEPVVFDEKSVKEAIGPIVRTLMNQYSFNNLQDFKGLLSAYNIHTNEVVGKVPGQRGLTYQITQDGQPVSRAIKASAYSFAPTIDKLENRFHNGTAKKEVYLLPMREKMDQAIKAYSQLNEFDYKSQLQAHGIELIDTGKNYLYVDTARRLVYRDAELGNTFLRENRYQYPAESIRQQPGRGTALPQKEQPVQDQETIARTSTPERRDRQSPARTPAQSGAGEVGHPTATSVIKQTDKSLLQPTPLPAPVVVLPPVLPATPRLTQPQMDELNKLMSSQYQQYKKEAGIYFESNLIQNFPQQLLIERLVKSGTKPEIAEISVASFRAYKETQLPAIKEREEATFQKNTDGLLTLAGQLNLTSAGKYSFLTQFNLEPLAEKTGLLYHKKNPDLVYQLTPEQAEKINQKWDVAKGQAATLSLPFSQPDRIVLLSLASGNEPVLASVSGVNLKSLQELLPHTLRQSVLENFNRIALKEFGEVLTKGVGGKLTSPLSLSEQALSRGLLMLPTRVNEPPKIGLYNTPPQSYQPLPVALQKLYEKELQNPASAATLTSEKTKAIPQTPERGGFGLPTAKTNANIITGQMGNVPNAVTGQSGAVVDHLALSRALSSREGYWLLRMQGAIDKGTAGQIEQTSQSVARIYPRLAGMPPQVLADQLREQVYQNARLPQPENKAQTTSAARRESASVGKAEYLALHKLYNGYLRQSPQRETTLLNKPGGFPREQLVIELISKTVLTRPEAESAVTNFQATRMSKREIILADDLKAFKGQTDGLIRLVCAAPISPAQRNELLLAHGLSIIAKEVRAPNPALGQPGVRQLNIVHIANPDLPIPLTQIQVDALRQPTKTNAQFYLPRQLSKAERGLQEAIGQYLVTRASTDPSLSGGMKTSTFANPIKALPEWVNHRTVTTARVHQLTPPDLWPVVSQQLDKASLSKLNVSFPAQNQKPESRGPTGKPEGPTPPQTGLAIWLHQRGFVVEAYPTHLLVGSPLTPSDKRQMIPLDAGQQKEQARTRLPSTGDQRTALTTPAGVMMQKLAHQLDAGRVEPGLIDRINNKFDLLNLEGRPNLPAALDELTVLSQAGAEVDMSVFNDTTDNLSALLRLGGGPVKKANKNIGNAPRRQRRR